MEKLNVFDVVELQDGNKATIIDNHNNKLIAEIVDSRGKKVSIDEIRLDSIKKILYRK